MIISPLCKFLPCGYQGNSDHSREFSIQAERVSRSDMCVSDVTNGNCPDTTVGLHSKRLDSNISFALSTYSIRISS